MGRIICTLVILVNAFHPLQAQSFEWARQMGGPTELDDGYSIAVDGSGNVYTTGRFYGTADFDPGDDVFNLTAENTDIFIQKLDAQGNFVWAKRMGSPYGDDGWTITTDQDGNVYTGGAFQDSVDFDPGNGEFILIASGSYDAFIQKLDSNGNFIWVKQIGIGEDRANDVVLALKTDALGNIYATGGVNELTIYLDAFVLKMDSEGNTIWMKQMGGALADDVGQSLAIDATGNVYSVGTFRNAGDFDPGTDTFNLSSKGQRDIFIQKLDADGNFLWAVGLGGEMDDFGYSIGTDAEGNIYTTGSFEGLVDFDPGEDTLHLTSIGGVDIFMQKLDKDGNLIWVKQTAGSAAEIAYSLTTDGDGNIYSIGYFADTVDFDPGESTYNLTSKGYSDIFIQKLNKDGDFVWAINMGTPKYYFGSGRSITSDLVGNIYATGKFGSTMDFDLGPNVFNMTSNGNADVFVLKLSGETSSISETVSTLQCLVSPNPTQSMIHVQTDQTIRLVGIYNLLGKLVQTETGNSFSIECLPAGIYLMQISTEKGLGMLRIVKE